jgi:hypothetical protein
MFERSSYKGFVVANSTRWIDLAIMHDTDGERCAITIQYIYPYASDEGAAESKTETCCSSSVQIRASCISVAPFYLYVLALQGETASEPGGNAFC